jgi:ABC-type Zn2+ transport system substrate-binding protein/surface adhesin
LFEKTRPNRKFCKEECRVEYNTYGSSFGKLKIKLAKDTAKQIAEQLPKAIAAAMKETNARLDDFERRLRAIEEPLQLLKSLTLASNIKRT